MQSTTSVSPKLGEAKPEFALARSGDRVLIKYETFSYYHVKWESIDAVLRLTHRTFESKINSALELDEPFTDLDTLVDQGVISESFLQPQKVLTFRIGARKTREWLVKWSGIKISESTWESEKLALLPRFSLSMTDLIDAFYFRNDATRKIPASSLTLADITNKSDSDNSLSKSQSDTPASLASLFIAHHVGIDGQTHLRSDGNLYAYQVQSVAWMLRNLQASRSCALAICMGAGKTIMSAVLLEFLKDLASLSGESSIGTPPYLVVAPLSTLLNWQRELEKWTGLHVVVFQGDKEDRELIKNFELSTVDISTGKPQKRALSAGGQVQTSHTPFDVVLVSYETLSSQQSFLKQFRFSVGIIDEAHRLKSESSLARQALLEMEVHWKVLLTGTPIQNNLKELWSLLNLLDEEKFADYGVFEKEVFGKTSADSVDAGTYAQLTKPYILRLSKEEILKDKIPPKTEVLVEVEYTQAQRELYKQILAKNASLLAQSRVKAQLVNVSMELRKCLCHPFLIKGFETAMSQSRKHRGSADLIASSGKMEFLRKLIVRCWERNEKILIFSQMTKMLDLIEETLVFFADLNGWAGLNGPVPTTGVPYERIDGGVPSAARQKSIDHFNSSTARECLVFLLSTNAGGVGVNLSSASVCCIYDSSFNPQQDSQAQARAHRIGNRSSKVTVYRLLTRSSYEMRLYEIAQKKLALERALEGHAQLAESPATGKGGVTLEEMEKLIIASGVHGTASSGDQMDEDQEVAGNSLTFDEMLEKHSRLVDESGEATESAVAETAAEGDSADFWRKLAGDFAMEESLLVRKTRWQGSFKQLAATAPASDAPASSDKREKVVDEKKAKLKTMVAGWKSRGGELFEKGALGEETDMFVYWLRKLYGVVEEAQMVTAGTGGWMKKLAGLRELQILRRLIVDLGQQETEMCMKTWFEQIKLVGDIDANAPEWQTQIHDLVAEESSRAALGTLNALEAQYGVSLLQRSAVGPPIVADASGGYRTREKWEEWLVDNKSKALWGNSQVLNTALDVIREVGLPVSYWPGKVASASGSVATSGTGPWVRTDWTDQDSPVPGAALAPASWSVEMSVIDDAWAVEVEQRMTKSDTRPTMVTGDFGLVLTGDDICNLGRAVAELLKKVKIPTGQDEAMKMDCSPWDLGTAVDTLIWMNGDRDQIVERWRLMHLLRRDAELILTTLSATDAMLAAELCAALEGRLDADQLRLLVAALGRHAQDRRKGRQEREKEKIKEEIRNSLTEVRTVVLEFLSTGGLSLAYSDKLLAPGTAAGTVDWRKQLLETEAQKSPEIVKPVADEWRAWRAMEKIVGFAASARKADMVEDKIKELMNAVVTGLPAASKIKSIDFKLILGMTVEELQIAAAPSTEAAEFVIFPDRKAALEALEMVQAIYMCRSLWLGGPRGSLWWMGGASANFRERVDEVEKEVFVLGGDCELLLDVALHGVGELSEEPRKRRKGETGEATEAKEFAKVEKVRQFFRVFIDKKKSKQRPPSSASAAHAAATAAAAAGSGAGGAQSSLTKWFTPKSQQP